MEFRLRILLHWSRWQNWQFLFLIRCCWRASWLWLFPRRGLFEPTFTRTTRSRHCIPKLGFLDLIHWSNFLTLHKVIYFRRILYILKNKFYMMLLMVIAIIFFIEATYWQFDLRTLSKVNLLINTLNFILIFINYFLSI